MQSLTKQEKIELLEELHRPLEDHWAVKTKHGNLDAKNSDYLYKLHITRLEDIYVNHKTQYPDPPVLLHKSPVSQLYGVNGLLSGNNENQKKKKEDNWLDNFQPVPETTTSQIVTRPISSSGTKKRNKSPAKSMHHSKSNLSFKNEHSMNNKQTNSFDNNNNNNNNNTKDNRKHRCYDMNISEEELIMKGMYKLNEYQDEIYKNFIEMISSFDEYDKANILEDVLIDTRKEDLLQFYGGTEMPKESNNIN